LDLNSWIKKFGEILGLNKFLYLEIFVGKKWKNNANSRKNVSNKTFAKTFR